MNADSCEAENLCCVSLLSRFLILRASTTNRFLHFRRFIRLPFSPSVLFAELHSYHDVPVFIRIVTCNKLRCSTYKPVKISISLLCLLSSLRTVAFFVLTSTPKVYTSSLCLYHRDSLMMTLTFTVSKTFLNSLLIIDLFASV